MKQSSSILLVCLALSGACSKVNKVEEAVTSTEKKMQEIAANSVETKIAAKETAEQTKFTYSLTTRTQMLESIMDKDSTLPIKMHSANVYFKSFEFQQIDEHTDPNLREVLYEEAVKEFTAVLLDLSSKIKLKKLTPDSAGNNELAFFALAAGIDELHHKQSEQVKKNPKHKSISFYGLVRSAFIKELKIGETMSAYEREMILTNQKDPMLDLIKARVDILTSKGLSGLTTKKKMNLGQKVKALLFKATFGRFGSIELPETYDTTDEETKKKIVEDLGGALKTRNFLREIGITKSLDGTLKSALQNIDFNEKSGPKEKSEDKRKELIRSQITDLLG
ncbi:MAG TPA: hypothetical protein VNJ08_08310 [Bacteriovoracaceae bacterium]|nr:hypothetical protein [Bacteriovoracaceae bacterium]